MNKLSVALAVAVLCVLIGALHPVSLLPMTATVLDQPQLDAEVTGQRLAADADDPLTNTAHAVFLPSIMEGHRTRLPCSPDSPFGVQVPPLYEVRVGTEEMEAPSSMTAAEWQALQTDVYYPMVMEALEASGACWVRIGIRWRKIQSDPSGPYSWGYYDNMLGQIAEKGVHMTAMVGGLPEWAAPSTNGPIYPDRLDDFAQFLADLVDHYKQPPYNIQTWELTNEPDWVTVDPDVGWGYNADQFAAMLSVAYPAIKAADPQATVLMGGLAYDRFTEYGGPFYRYFPDEVMEAGGGVHLDSLNFHYFPDFAPEWERWLWGLPEYPEAIPPTCGDVENAEDGGAPYEAWGTDIIAKAKHLHNRMLACYDVDLPMWVTEFSEHGYPDDFASQAQQARYVFQGYARALAAGIVKAFWMTLAPSLTSGGEHGLVYVYEDHWSPKPAFYSYQAIASELVGYEYARTLEADSLEGYVFQNAAGQEQTVVWSWGDSQDSGVLSFTPASHLRVVDRFAGKTYVQDGGPQDADGQENGTILFQLPAVPPDPDPGDQIRFTAEPLVISAWP